MQDLPDVVQGPHLQTDASNGCRFTRHEELDEAQAVRLIQKNWQALRLFLNMFASSSLIGTMALLRVLLLRDYCSGLIEFFSLSNMDVILLSLKTFTRSSRPTLLWVIFSLSEDRYPVFPLPSVIFMCSSWGSSLIVDTVLIYQTDLRSVQ